MEKNSFQFDQNKKERDSVLEIIRGAMPFCSMFSQFLRWSSFLAAKGFSRKSLLSLSVDVYVDKICGSNAMKEIEKCGFLENFSRFISNNLTDRLRGSSNNIGFNIDAISIPEANINKSLCLPISEMFYNSLPAKLRPNFISN